MADRCLISTLNWVWYDPAVTFSGGSWVDAPTVRLANLLNTKPASYARSTSASREDAALRIGFGAAWKMDHVYLGGGNLTNDGLVRIATQPPPFEWDFRTATLPDGMAVTRSSGEASYWTADGVMEWIGTSGPRWDRDPMTGECRGLLVETIQNNRIIWSEDLTEWSATNATVDDDAGIAPDGEADMCKVEETTDTGGHGVVLSAAWPTESPCLVSGFVEADEREWFCVRLYDGTNTRYIFFNASTGAVGHVGSGLSEARMDAIPGGRWRWSVLWTPAVGTGSVGLWLATADGGDAIPSYAGTAGHGLLPWGFQAGYTANNSGVPRPSSYIRTAGDMELRWSDAVTWGGVEFAQHIPPSAVSATFALTVAIDGAPTSGTPFVGSISDGTSANAINLFIRSAGGGSASVVVSSEGSSLTATAAGVWDRTPVTIAVSVGLGVADLAFNGSLAAPEPTGMPPVDRLSLGTGSIGLTVAGLMLGAERVSGAALATGSVDVDAMADAWPGMIVPWTRYVPVTHAPVGGFIPFGRPSPDGRVPSDERDPVGVSRLFTFDPVETSELFVEFSDPGNPAGYVQIAKVWAGMSVRPTLPPIAGAFTIGVVEEARRRRSLGGTLHARRLWMKRRLTAVLEYQPEAEALPIWLETLRRLGGTEPLLFAQLAPDGVSAINEPRLTILGVLEEPAPVEHQVVDMWRWSMSIVEL